jgi:hypothetical protein
MKNSPDTQALEQICGDMDDMESKKMFDKPEDHSKGVSITIDVVPKGAEPTEKEEAPEPDETMNKGGMVDDEMKLPPFLRKKK